MHCLFNVVAGSNQVSHMWNACLSIIPSSATLKRGCIYRIFYDDDTNAGRRGRLKMLMYVDEYTIVQHSMPQDDSAKDE